MLALMSVPSDISHRVRQLAQDLLRDLEKIEQLAEASPPADGLYLRLAAVLDHCLTELKALNLWGLDNRLPSSELWNAAGQLLCRGWLQNQAHTKPRGYAGDYQMLARIYENRLCDDPLGRLFDRYFQLQAAPQAVRNRMSMMADWIVDAAGSVHDSPLTIHHSLRIAVVGSAFGLEVRDALRRLPESAREQIRITLLDLDPAAIDFARAELAPLVRPDQLMATSTNLFRLADRQEAAAALRDTDCLFCPGLFDYLHAPAATDMIRTLYEQLAPGGCLTVFQFAPHNPTRAYMEWFANWYLTYRDEADFRRLVDSAGLSGASATFGAEPLGTDLYVTVTKS
jgi:extracellular factor (EF) 3-hydroxypalmitic acid methyl ester biosynthesis protein